MAKAQAQEPSMEEILASIRRIIADEDAAQARAVSPPPKAASTAPPPPPKPALLREVPPPAPAAADLGKDTLDEEDLDRLFSKADQDEVNGADVIELSEADIAADIGTADLALLEPEPPPPPSPPSPRPAASQGGRAPARNDGPALRAAAEPDGWTAAAAARAPEPPRRPAEATPVEATHAEAPPREALLSPAADAAVARAFNQLAGTILSQNARTLEDLVGDMLRPMLKEWLDENLPALVERLVRSEIERVSRGNRY